MQNVIDGMQINVVGNVTPFAAAMDKASAIARTESKKIKDEINKAVRESKGSLMLLGETVGVAIPRHLQTFVSKLPGVATAMSAAFNTVAVFALLDVVVRAGEKVAELTEKLKKSDEAAGRMYQSMGTALLSIQSSNDELTVTNDKLQASIDKLQHKPHNGIKDAIDEAVVVADTLLKKLTSAYDEIGKTLSANTSGVFSAVMANKSTNSDIATDWYAHKNENLAATQENQRNIRALNPNDKAGLERENTRYLTKLASIHNSYLALLTREYNLSTDDKRKAMLGFAKDSENATYQLPQGELKHAALENQEHGLQEAAAAASLLSTAERMAAKALDQATTQQRERISHYNRLDVAGNQRTLAQQFQYLNGISPEAGNKDYLSQLRNEVWNKMQAQHMDTSGRVTAPSIYHNYNKTTSDNPLAQIKANGEMVTLAEAAAKVNAMQSIRGIEWNRQSGQLSHYAAAMQIAAVHTKEFNTQLDLLKVQRDTLNLDISTGKMSAAVGQVALTKNQYNTDSLQSDRRLQNAEDTFNTLSQTATAGFQKFFTDFANDANNTANAVHSAMSTASGSFNDALTAGIMGHNKSQNWSHAFEATGSSIIHSGLKRIETLGATASKPMWVKVVGAGGSTGTSETSGSTGIGTQTSGFFGKVGGFFSSFAHILHIPGFAGGGQPDPYGTSIVGENGPELFTPHGVAGTITPNNKLHTISSGANTIYQVGNVNASGANMAEVNKRVEMGMIAAHNAAVKSTMKAQQEKSRRMPAGRR